MDLNHRKKFSKFVTLQQNHLNSLFSYFGHTQLPLHCDPLVCNLSATNRSKCVNTSSGVPTLIMTYIKVSVDHVRDIRGGVVVCMRQLLQFELIS